MIVKVFQDFELKLDWGLEFDFGFEFRVSSEHLGHFENLLAGVFEIWEGD